MRPLLGGRMRYSTPFCLVRRRAQKITRPVGFVVELIKDVCAEPARGPRRVRGLA
jgi:hypothetical protein